MNNERNFGLHRSERHARFEFDDSEPSVRIAHPKTCPPCNGDCSQGDECPVWLNQVGRVRPLGLAMRFYGWACRILERM